MKLGKAWAFVGRSHNVVICEPFIEDFNVWNSFIRKSASLEYDVSCFIQVVFESDKEQGEFMAESPRVVDSTEFMK